MALINCPQCGKSISDKAVKCPHCGVTFNKENTHSIPQDSNPTVVDEQNKGLSDNSGKAFVTFGVAIIIIVVVAFLGLIAYSYYQFSTKDEVEVADEAKSIRTMDLSAFMLHGKVKRVTESSYLERGVYNTIYDFNEQGKLIRVNDTSCRTSTVNDKYTIWYENVNQVYTFDSKGRIIRLDEEFDEIWGANCEYSEYNECGWPTKEVDLTASWQPTQLVYSVIDKYGNWTQCERVTESHTLTIYREIEYYPIGQ